MIFYLDTEFNGFGGDLLTLALVSEDKNIPPLYLARNDLQMIVTEKWVAENVIPKITLPGSVPTFTHVSYFGKYIAEYLNHHSKADAEITIVADWPDDIRYLMMTLITGPGMMVNIKEMDVCLRRCDPWKDAPENPGRHNALIDAKKLRELFE